MSPQHHWFSDNTDEARQWSEEISIKTDITTNFIIFPSKCTVKHPIVLCCAANTTIKTTISLKITLDESDWIFQTRREKILEARNKEIRLKEKTKVTTKLFPIKILQWGLCPRNFFLRLSLFFRECLVLEDLGQKRLEVTQCHVLEAGLDSVMPPVDFWPKTIGASCSRCLAISINIFGSNKMLFLLYFRVRGGRYLGRVVQLLNF